MKKEKKETQLPATLKKVDREIESLMELFEYYLTERKLSRPIETLQEIIRDLRVIVGRILTSHFIHLSLHDEDVFCRELASLLAKKGVSIKFQDETDEKHCNYLIKEILTSFEWAQEIKKELPDDAVMQEVLVIDIPVLRPFNYAIKNKQNVVEKKKSIGKKRCA